MIVAYTILGSNVSGNVLQDVPQNTVVTVAIGFEMINLFGTYLITFNPVAQAFEEMGNVPHGKTNSLLADIKFTLKVAEIQNLIVVNAI